MNNLTSSDWSARYTSELEEMANELWDAMQLSPETRLREEYEAIMQELAIRNNEISDESH